MVGSRADTTGGEAVLASTGRQGGRLGRVTVRPFPSGLGKTHQVVYEILQAPRDERTGISGGCHGWARVGQPERPARARARIELKLRQRLGTVTVSWPWAAGGGNEVVYVGLLNRGVDGSELDGKEERGGHCRGERGSSIIGGDDEERQVK